MTLTSNTIPWLERSELAVERAKGNLLGIGYDRITQVGSFDIGAFRGILSTSSTNVSEDKITRWWDEVRKKIDPNDGLLPLIYSCTHDPYTVPSIEPDINHHVVYGSIGPDDFRIIFSKNRHLCWPSSYFESNLADEYLTRWLDLKPLAKDEAYSAQHALEPLPARLFTSGEEKLIDSAPLRIENREKVRIRIVAERRLQFVPNPEERRDQEL